MYNLCCEKDRQYDHGKFNDQVECFPFEDHQAPPIGLIHKFCLSVDAFLKQSDQNVVAVHCKAGKGRTGLMICAYLLYSGRFNSAAKAMEFYGDKRTKDGKGVTIPSQKRFIRYYNTVLDRGFPAARRTKLLKLYISSLPVGMETFVAFYQRSHDTLSPYSVIKMEATFSKKESQCYAIEDNTKKRIQNVRCKVAGSTHKALFEEESAPEFEGDVKVVVYKKKMKKKNFLFSAWINTAFVPSTNRVVAMKADLDKCKKSLPQDVKLVMHFTGDGAAEEEEEPPVTTTRGQKLIELSNKQPSSGGSSAAAPIGELPRGLDDEEQLPRTPSTRSLGGRQLSSHEIDVVPMTPNSRKDAHIERLETEMSTLKEALKEMVNEQATNSEDLKLRLNEASSDKRRLELELVEKTQDFASSLFDMEQQLSYTKDECKRLAKEKEALEQKVGELESVPTETLNDIIADLEEQNKELRGENDSMRAKLEERESSNKLIEETFSGGGEQGAEVQEPGKTELVGSLNVSLDKMNQLMSLLKKEQDANEELNKKLQRFLSMEQRDEDDIDRFVSNYV